MEKNIMAKSSKRQPVETATTVAVALNRQTGIAFPMPDGRKVVINGNAAHLRGREKGILPVGAFGITVIQKDDWDYIEKKYGGMDIFKNGLLFAADKKSRAQDEATEKEELRHGLEPVDVSKTRTEPNEAAQPAA